MITVSAVTAVCSVVPAFVVWVRVAAGRTAAGFVMVEVAVLVVAIGSRWRAGGGATRSGPLGMGGGGRSSGHLVSRWCGMWVGRCAAGGCC